jgi:hypothetical protein
LNVDRESHAALVISFRVMIIEIVGRRVLAN